MLRFYRMVYCLTNYCKEKRRKICFIQFFLKNKKRKIDNQYFLLMQQLDQFKMPPDFRGRPGWFVQLWWIVEAILFRPSPQFMYGWRRFLLRSFGATIV